MIRRTIYITFILLTFPGTCIVKAQHPSVYKVTRMSFNTSVSSEISPVIVEDNIVFCSDRRFSGIKDRTSFEGKRIYNIYLATRKDTMNWEKLKMLRSERSALFNNGPLCFAPDGKTIYFTSEIETGKAIKKRNFRNHCGIFIAELKGTDLVSLRPFKYNNPQYEVGQPSISKDGKYLFFASDMPGGQGRSDLYYCENINGEWSFPVNLGSEVNSPTVENYPYMHPSGKLYFSSNRPGGNGRLDVYYTILNFGRWEPPVLMPEPINSPSDDFAFVANEDLQTGYFSSNRRFNDDIYEFASTIIRKAYCDTLVENNYCYQMIEENAVKFDTLPFRYEWKYGDGNKGIGPSVVHCYSGPGSYLVQLDVVNLITKEILYNEKTYNLVIRNVEQPYFSCPDTGTAGQRIRFTADASNLPGWKIDRYYWNFGDETIEVGREVDKAYLKPGIYNIQMIVSTVPEPGGVIREACVSKNITIIR